MPRMTLRKWLDQPNPEFKVDPRIRASTHQTDNDRIHMNGWRPWEGFNLKQINTLFGHILDAEYNFPDLKPIEKAHLVVANEPTLEFAVGHWNLEIVNTALRVVTRNGPHLLWSCGASAKFPSEKCPDWSAVRNDTSNIDRPS